MVLKIKTKDGYYVNQDFRSFQTKENTVDVNMFNGSTDIVQYWEEIYLLDKRGKTLDTIKK